MGEGEVVANNLQWAVGLLQRSMAMYNSEAVQQMVEWEAMLRCFLLGNPDGANITMGSLHRFPMYEGNDFRWELPLALRSRQANMIDNKILVFTVREGKTMDLKVCLTLTPCLDFHSRWRLC